ncbi:MAG: hypothetical protein CSA39_06905 [Flavobacteriales bacterium]|nr:MAG: hypothetical protein CR985_00925 [Flavobacteriales bacterium]PIE48606.1 MAG: hypothetical protein CSA39_06905 [Flavobacteriales bacterium]
MKNIIILTGVLLFTLNLPAQRGNRERIEAYKKAYITDKLNLTAAEAEKFWPVYNAFNDTIFELKKTKSKILAEKIKSKEGVNKLSDAEVDEILEQFLQIEEKNLTAKKALFAKLKNKIPTYKILKLIHAEMSFKKFLLQRMSCGHKDHNR